jgi:hypothetical protein
MELFGGTCLASSLDSLFASQPLSNDGPPTLPSLELFVVQSGFRRSKCNNQLLGSERHPNKPLFSPDKCATVRNQ